MAAVSSHLHSRRAKRLAFRQTGDRPKVFTGSFCWATGIDAAYDAWTAREVLAVIAYLFYAIAANTRLRNDMLSPHAASVATGS